MCRTEKNEKDTHALLNVPSPAAKTFRLEAVLQLARRRHGLEDKLDVAGGGTAGAGSADAAGGALVAGSTDALLPLVLGDVDGGACGCGLDGEAGGAGLADGGGRVALAGGRGARDAAADGELG